MGMLHPSSLAYSTAPCAMYRNRVWLAYLRAPLDTWRMTGDLDSTQACMMACICSMLLKLNAGMAYFPAIAFLKMSREFTRPSSLYETMIFYFLVVFLLCKCTFFLLCVLFFCEIFFNFALRIVFMYNFNWMMIMA